MNPDSLGQARDLCPIPLPSIPWAEGDAPAHENLDLNEYAVLVLKLRRCRTFRADLLHKLQLIMRAAGGYGRGGQIRAARRLKVNRHTLRRWLSWKAAPKTRQGFERIDDAYDLAIRELVKEKCRKKKRRSAGPCARP
jgi:hypothetical protein